MTAGELTIPGPAGGFTARRHNELFRWGLTDLSLARIAEAHTDAQAILAEAGRPARENALYGVWASDGPGGRLTCEQQADGDWCLMGMKAFCSGATFATAALVTAHHGDGVLLFDVPLSAPGISVQPSQWKNPAFEDTGTVAVAFESVVVSAGSPIGSLDWYLTRPGFWHGAIGPAACWAGGAASLIEAARLLDRRDAHSRAHVGALLAIQWGFNATLEQAGREIDEDPMDRRDMARVRALKVRHLIERACMEVLDRFGRATGPQLLAYDAHIIRQHAALSLYVRQCHGERDLENIPCREPA